MYLPLKLLKTVQGCQLLMSKYWNGWGMNSTCKHWAFKHPVGDTRKHSHPTLACFIFDEKPENACLGVEGGIRNQAVCFLPELHQGP